MEEVGVILQGTLSPNPDERKAAEQRLDQIQYAPHHLPTLLQIIVHSNSDISLRQVAAIHFKNFIAKNWSPSSTDADADANHTISISDKDLVRNHILLFLPQLPSLLRVQLVECLKTILHSDYPDQCPHLLDWIKHNLQDQQQVYSALFVLRILSIKYEFKSDEDRTPAYHIVEETFPHLLNIFNSLVQIANPSLEVADLIKLICKIFWSSIYLEIPKILFDQNVFNAWMVLFLNVLERPVPLEGQPVDPDLRKSWGWWKVKKWTIHILNRLYTRCGDLKLRNTENRAFAQMFHKHFAGKILDCHLNLLNVIRVGGYLPDRVINLVLQYLSNRLSIVADSVLLRWSGAEPEAVAPELPSVSQYSAVAGTMDVVAQKCRPDGVCISKKSMYTVLQPRLDVLLFEIVFPLMCFNDDDQKLWDEDPHEYVRKGYDIIEDLYSPRTASVDFVSELVRKRREDNFHKFIQFIVEILKRYDEAPVEYKSYRQKDGALLAIGTLCDKLKQTEPYKSELERMLVQHVFPEFGSPVGHLRAKAAWVAGQYAHISFSDQNNFRKALQCVVCGMRDPELPVRIDSVFALRSFIEACKDLYEIRPLLPPLLDEFFKLMNEVENEDLVFTLETIVDKFGEEMAPYALGLCQNLAAAFWRCMNTADADDEADDPSSLAAVGCLRAISTILESVSSLPQLFVQIEPTLLPIMRSMLTTDGQDILVPLDNYISRGTAHFITCKEPDYQQSLWNMISSLPLVVPDLSFTLKLMADKNMEDSDIEPAPKLIEIVFLNCRGLVDHWVEPYLRITVERLHGTGKSYLKCLLMQVIADGLYYNATLTLSILHKLGVASEIFNLWFHMLQEVKKSGVRSNFKREHGKKVCCLGLISLLALPADQLPGEALGRVFRATLDLLVAYKDQVAEAAKEEEEEEEEDDDDMNGFQSDDEDEDDSGSDREMGADAEDGDEADSSKLIKLTDQAKSFRPNNEDDDDSDDDFSDDEELQSPIDEVDPFIFFVDTMKVMQSSDPMKFQNLTQTLEFSYQALANGVAQHAEMRRGEIEKEKAEKSSATTDS
ncbi:hypothetical protein TSUD_00190 [Trifolium subterraneum]|nr:hypothetical protein TSUD_00190 [Trifolium subterraneum]